jgi:HD-like signal output (HDOD) protein
MLAGLLHDIGTLPILDRAEERSELLETPGLLDHLITSLHTRVGGAILRHWKFPDPLVEVAEQHEDLSRSHDGGADLVDVVQVANLQSHMGSEHALGTVDWTQVAAFHQLGLDDDVDEIELTDRVEELEEVQELFL